MANKHTKFKIDFIMELGKALHRYGTNAFRMEAALEATSNKLGLNGQFFSTPTMIMASFNGPDGHVTRLERMKPGYENLDKLHRVDKMADKVVKGQMDPQIAISELDSILNGSHLYGPKLTILSYAAVSMAFVVFLKGSVYDFFPAFCLGGVTGVLSHWVRNRPRLKLLFESMAALLVALGANLFKVLWPQVSVEICTLAALIKLLPGLGLATAVAELATTHLASGTARLMGAMMDLFKIIFGVLLANQLALKFLQVSAQQHDLAGPDLGVRLVAFLVACWGLLIYYRAQYRDFGWVLLAGAVGSMAAHYGQYLFQNDMGVFWGGLAVGLIANLFSRLKNRPSALILLPGVIFLVPGSLSYKGLNLFFSNQILVGAENLFAVIIVLISLVAGLFFGNVLINPRRYI